MRHWHTLKWLLATDPEQLSDRVTQYNERQTQRWAKAITTPFYGGDMPQTLGDGEKQMATNLAMQHRLEVTHMFQELQHGVRQVSRQLESMISHPHMTQGTSNRLASLRTSVDQLQNQLLTVALHSSLFDPPPARND